MDGLAKMDGDELIRRMRADFEQTMREVADAVNGAADGHLIDGSEEPVRDLLGDFRRRSFETAAQLRVEATEASADFSPGQARPGEPGCVGSHDAQLQRSGGAASAPRANKGTVLLFAVFSRKEPLRGLIGLSRMAFSLAQPHNVLESK